MEVGLEPLAVLSPQLATHPAGAADHGGNGEVAAAGVAQHAHVVGDLVEGQQQKAHVHSLHNRAQARHGGAHGHAGEGIFGNRRIQHPQFAVLLVEVLGHLVGAAVLADVLTHHADVGVAGHLLVDGFPEGIEQQGFCHGGPCARSASTYLSRRRRRWRGAAPKATCRATAALPAGPDRGESWREIRDFSQLRQRLMPIPAPGCAGKPGPGPGQ